MSEYQGMRWFKSDLHMHTPEDAAHWDKNDSIRLASPRRIKNNGNYIESDIQEKARQFLRQCHAHELDVIAVTDHNFSALPDPRDWFLTHLIEQNDTESANCGRSPLWIFPGFEIDIGFHLICLFDPINKTKHLEKINNVLTTLGMSYDKRVVNGKMSPLRHDGQYVSLRTVIEKIQNESGGMVVAAHAFAKDGIANETRNTEDYRNEDLLCVEVPKYPLEGRVKEIIEGTNIHWRRPNRQPAYIRSSDAKSIQTSIDGSPKENSIGFRHTWIKMSLPSIESLRQAFLDNESRIRLQPGAPHKDNLHEHIVSIDISKGAFLTDQKIRFSPNLNCLIGGRGTGKSTVMEYMRFGVRQEDDPLSKDQVDRIRKTLKQDSTITIEWKGAEGLEDRFEYRHGFGKAGIKGRDVSDPSTVFRSLGIQVFSQRQLNEIAQLDDGQPSFMMPLIDGLCGSELSEQIKSETELRDRLTTISQQKRVFERLKQEYKALEQEAAELNRQMGAIAAIQEEGKRYRYSQEAERYLKRVINQSNETELHLNEMADGYLETISPIGSVIESWPCSPYFKKLENEIENAISGLYSDIRLAGQNYHLKIQSITEKSEQWPSVTEAIKKAEQDFIEACERQGLFPQDVERLREISTRKRSKAYELEEKNTLLKQVENSVKGFDELLKELHNIWKAQTNTRKDDIKEILSGKGIRKVPVDPDRPAGEKQPFIDIVIRYSGDDSHFNKLWNGLVPDGRSKLGREWYSIARTLFNGFLTAGDRIGSPWELLLGWFTAPNTAPKELQEYIEPLKDYLLNEQRDLWEKLRLNRIKDSVDLILYRQDGRRAGSLRDGGLSDGQRNTAVLSLLLAKGTGPILIDQPEDELDSNFIYDELVPLLRHIKERRQIILVTHNANLPVNGDAELVYALKAEGGHGVKYAEGGLDRKEVKEAVLEIMEGSEEAFRKRREKYHF